MEQKVRLARAWLSRVSEPGDATVWRYVDQFGPVEAVGRLRAGQAPVEVAATVETCVDPALARADLEEAEVDGQRLIGPEDQEWPAEALRGLATAAAAGDDGMAPPLVLWLLGEGALGELLPSAVAIVGARAATPYGHTVAADLGFTLGRAGFTVISGSGHGIDTSALRGAVAGERPAVAVLASGLGRRYPTGNELLLGQVAAAGVLVSLFPPSWLPTIERVRQGRRLIGELASATVVVEAAVDGGALLAAEHARLLGRPVLAVPGPVTSAMSAGTHRLLRDHRARIAAGPEDVLAALDQPDA